MRVLICSSTYLPHLNGQAVFTVSLAEGLVANGHRVTLLVPREVGQPHHEIIQGVEVVRVPALRLGWIHPDLNIPFGIPPSIQRIFDQFQPQVVHVQDPSPLSQVVMRKARRLNIPVIANHHSGNAVTAPYFQTHHPLLKRITEWAAWRLLLAHLKQADLTIVPSRYSASNLESRGFHHPVRIIPCGVRLDVFHPAPSLDRQAVRQIYRLDSDKTLFLYVGRVDTEKRLEVILQAIARTKNENIQFAIAGRGNELASLQQLTERLNLSRKVRFLDQVDHDALPDLLNSADVFVMPGDSESFSIATLEAMACGKPILAVRSGALPQLVTHMENGFLYDARQPESAACGIEMLSIDQERRIQMGSLSLERARSYSQANIVRMYQETYRTSIGQKVNASSRNSAGDKARSPARRSILPALRAAMLLILLVISTIFYDEVQAVSNVKLSDLAPLNWTPGQRLLVIAPHPDDEVSAAGGLIQKTMETGGQVQVVIVTNGDALVAVSGGKDSLALWDILTRLGYQADGLYIGLGIVGASDLPSPAGYSAESGRLAQKFAQERQLVLHVMDVQQAYGFSIPALAEATNRGMGRPCSVCGLVKRHVMNRIARDLGYDVLATGHNLDDEAAVLLSNTLTWAGEYLLRQGPVLRESPGLARKVKPLCRFYEREMTAYALLRGIEYIYEECPYAAGSTTIYNKELLNRLESQRPGAKLNFYLRFLQAREEGLFAKLEEQRADLQPCPQCGQPTSAPGLCSFCRLLEKTKNMLARQTDGAAE